MATTEIITEKFSYSELDKLFHLLTGSNFKPTAAYVNLFPDKTEVSDRFRFTQFINVDPADLVNTYRKKCFEKCQFLVEQTENCFLVSVIN